MITHDPRTVKDINHAIDALAGGLGLPANDPVETVCVVVAELALAGRFVGCGAKQRATTMRKSALPNGKTAAGVLMGLCALAAQAVTTHCGDFSFNKLTPAKYQVIVKYLGYQPAEETVTFRQLEQSNLPSFL